MEIAAILSIILLDYVDFILIFGLLFLNAIIGYHEETSAGNAIAVLTSTLSPKAKGKTYLMCVFSCKLNLFYQYLEMGKF
jgi:hypothetical protein